MFDPNKMSSFFEAVEAIGKFCEAIRQIRVPNVPVAGQGDTGERLENLEQFAQDVSEALGVIRDSELPMLDVSRESLDDAMAGLDAELNRTREGNIQVIGATDVQVNEGGIVITLPTVEEQDPATDPTDACFPITLTQTGGTAVADDTTQADWTYTIMDRWGATLKNAAGTDLTGAAPTTYGWVRPTVGYLTAATKGAAYRDEDGELVIVFINEVADGAACG